MGRKFVATLLMVGASLAAHAQEALDGVDAVLSPPFAASSVAGVVAPLLEAYHRRLDDSGE